MSEKLEEIKEKIYNSDLTKTSEYIKDLTEEEMIELVNSITEDRDFYKNKINILENNK